MTYAASRSYPSGAHSTPVCSSQDRTWGEGDELSCRKSFQLDLTEDQALRRMVRKALWHCYPGAASNEHLAELARFEFLNKSGRPVSRRTIINWLDGDVTPSGVHMMKLLAMTGPAFWFTGWKGAA